MLAVIASILKSLPWRKLLPYIIGAIAILSLVVKMQILTSSLNKAMVREVSYLSQIDTAKKSIENLSSSITEQNEAIKKIKIESDRANTMQKLADDLAIKVDIGKSRIVAANRRIKLLESEVAGLPACETYEAALKAISGVGDDYNKQ